MENQIPEVNSVSEPVEAAKTPEPATTPLAPKQSSNSFIVILLSILLIISCVIAGFFAYQTQKLVNELNKNQTVLVTPTPIATVEPTVEPTASGSATIDTTNWKTYVNTSANYQIKYPTDWKITNQSAGSLGKIVPDARYIEIGLGEGKSGTVGIEELDVIPPSENVNLNFTKVIGNITLKCNSVFKANTKTWCWVKVPNQEKQLNLQMSRNTDESMNVILDQILSTFKFTN